MTGVPAPAWRPTQDLLALLLEGRSWREHEMFPAGTPPPSADEMLLELGAAEEIAARMAASRWSRVRDCRRSGASWEQIGRVLGLSAVAAHAGFVAWIDRGRSELGVASYPADLDVFAAPDPSMTAAAAPGGAVGPASS